MPLRAGARRWMLLRYDLTLTLKQEYLIFMKPTKFNDELHYCPLNSWQGIVRDVDDTWKRYRPTDMVEQFVDSYDLDQIRNPLRSDFRRKKTS
jgi:hypothetical protein